jgi:cytochrome c-type biogenesis protein
MFEGGVFDLEAFQGRPIWINVWASWCPPCRVEFPDIDEIRRGAADDGLVFLAINFGESSADIRSFLENTGYTFDVGLDVTGDFEALYQVRSLPMHIFIARDGSVDSLRVGGMTRREMEEKVAELTAPFTTEPAAAAR